MKITLSREEVEKYVIAGLTAKYSTVVPPDQKIAVKVNYSGDAEIDIFPAVVETKEATE